MTHKLTTKGRGKKKKRQKTLNLTIHPVPGVKPLQSGGNASFRAIPRRSAHVVVAIVIVPFMPFVIKHSLNLGPPKPTICRCPRRPRLPPPPPRQHRDHHDHHHRHYAW